MPTSKKSYAAGLSRALAKATGALESASERIRALPEKPQSVEDVTRLLDELDDSHREFERAQHQYNAVRALVERRLKAVTRRNRQRAKARQRKGGQQ
jgi:hypothetical protein